MHEQVGKINRSINRLIFKGHKIIPLGVVCNSGVVHMSIFVTLLPSLTYTALYVNACFQESHFPSNCVRSVHIYAYVVYFIYTTCIY